MRYVCLALLAIFFGGLALPALAAWSGPQATLANKNGRKVLRICDTGGGCTQSTPFFLGLNTQALDHNWPTFLAQARLQLAHVSASSNGTVPILQVHLSHTGDLFLRELANQLNTLSPRPYLFLRMYLQPSGYSGERMALNNLEGQAREASLNHSSEWALNEAWLSHQKNEIGRILTSINQYYPGRLIGVHISYALDGEWFFRPSVELNGQILPWGQNACGTGAECFPWTNDSQISGPIGRHFFYLFDYSATAAAGFCSWNQLPAVLRTNCRAASVVERNNAVPGQPKPALGKARGALLNPQDIGSMRAAYYNRYVSVQNVKAIIALLEQAKAVTENRILTSTFYGYLYALGPALPSSGHTAMTDLLASSAVDILSGPYSYGASRRLGQPLSAQGPPDTLLLSNKLWFDEDDTRTHFAEDDPAPGDEPAVTTLWNSIQVLRRNLIKAGLHNHGSYFLDLEGEGWFGPTAGGDGDTLWANLENAFRAVDKLQLNAPNRYDAQVAVFSDDLSANYVAALTPASDHTPAFTADIGDQLIDQLARIGTPMKQYLLSDLLKPNLDLSAIKLAVIANAWNVPDNIRQQINSKLKTGGRTVLFVYAAGYINGDHGASAGNISSLTGINVQQGGGTPALSQNFNVNGQSVPDGRNYPLTPWFSISDPGVTVLGTYSVAGGVSLARKVLGSYTSVVAAAPRLTTPILRKISEDAGVHHFTAAGDFVEAAGNMVMVHAASDGYRNVNFPQAMPRIFETAIYPTDSLLCNACAALSQQLFYEGNTRVFRWTSPPRGNFDFISGTNLVGWAADFDLPTTSIVVHVYSGGPAGVGSFLTYFVASAPRPDLTAVFGIPGNNGFNVNIGSCPSGTRLYAYAIDPEGSNADPNSFIGSQTCP